MWVYSPLANATNSVWSPTHCDSKSHLLTYLLVSSYYPNRYPSACRLPESAALDSSPLFRHTNAGHLQAPRALAVTFAMLRRLINCRVSSSQGARAFVCFTYVFYAKKPIVTRRSAIADCTAPHVWNVKRASFLLGVGAFRPKFYGNGVISCQSVEYRSIGRLVDRATTLPLEVFRQLNFVAEF